MLEESKITYIFFTLLLEAEIDNCNTQGKEIEDTRHGALLPGPGHPQHLVQQDQAGAQRLRRDIMEA